MYYYKKNFKIKKTSKTSTGFAMLFAVLTASLLLTIGLSIFNLSFKELILSTNARESQVAFYAADSARECVLYWDVKKGAIPSCLDNGCVTKTIPDINLPSISCNGLSDTLQQSQPSGSVISYTQQANKDFFIKYSATSNLEPAASVIIKKEWNDLTKKIVTTIEARGYNTSVIGRRLERGIQQINEN